MREYPPDQPRLDEIAGYLAGQLAQRPVSPVITTYLSTQLQRVRDAMAAVEAEEQAEALGPNRWRLTTLPTGVGQPKRGRICDPDCFAAGDRPLTREQALRLLDDPRYSLDDCEACHAGQKLRPG